MMIAHMRIEEKKHRKTLADTHQCFTTQLQYQQQDFDLAKNGIENKSKIHIVCL